VGFNLYRGAQAGGPYTKMNSSELATASYTDSSVTAGQTYYYVATDVNSSGQESTYSNQVTAAIP
jgi:fibronectin type 3 domain-containing protein